MSARTRSSFRSSRGQGTARSYVGSGAGSRAAAARRSGATACLKATRACCPRRRDAVRLRLGVAPGPEAGGRRVTVALLPRDDRIAEHADPLDLGLDHVARLEIEA